jgi:hypothetical protein
MLEAIDVDAMRWKEEELYHRQVSTIDVNVEAFSIQK